MKLRKGLVRLAAALFSVVLLVLFSVVLLALGASGVNAHPLSPALLQLDEVAPGRIDIAFKLPARGGLPGLSPWLPSDCAAVTPVARRQEGSGVVWSWRVECGAPLATLRVGVRGLDTAGATALLRARDASGDRPATLLTADAPTTLLAGPPDTKAIALRFGRLGIQHLLLGLDHVLFVALLTWAVGWSRRLLWTVTSFTLGHSVTLALATLGVVAFPTRVVEALIALTLVVAAAELVRSDGRGLLARAPVPVGVGFGLLHGMGFAGALSETGLPAHAIPAALLSFNLGIEIAQIAVVIPAAALAWVFRAAPAPLSARVRPLSGYALGTLAAGWLWQQVGVAG